MDFPGSAVTPPHIHTFAFNTGVGDTRYTANVGHDSISITWPSANRAIYTPVSLRYPYAVNRVFWGNGATAGGNVDFGIYTPSGTRIFSTGSTAQSGTSVLQYATPSTPFVLAPGSYLFALAVSGTTGAVLGQTATVSVANMRMAGFLEESSALPLPATATFATITSVAIPFCGVTRTTTGY